MASHPDSSFNLAQATQAVAGQFGPNKNSIDPSEILSNVRDNSPHQQKKLCFIIKEHAKVSKDLRYVQIPNLAKRFLTRDFVTRVSGKLASIVTLR